MAVSSSLEEHLLQAFQFDNGVVAGHEVAVSEGKRQSGGSQRYGGAVGLLQHEVFVVGSLRGMSHAAGEGDENKKTSHKLQSIKKQYY